MQRGPFGIAICVAIVATTTLFDKSQFSSVILSASLNILSSFVFLYLTSPTRPTFVGAFFARLFNINKAAFTTPKYIVGIVSLQLVVIECLSLFLLQRAAFSVTGEMTYWAGEKQLVVSDYALDSLWYGMIGQMMFATLPIFVILNSVIVGTYYRNPKIIVFILSWLLAYALDQAYAVYAKMPNVVDDFTDLPRA